MIDERIAKLEALLARIHARKRNGAPVSASGATSTFAIAPPPPPTTTTTSTATTTTASKPNGAPRKNGFDRATPVESFFPSQPPPVERASATPPKPPAPSTIAPPDASLDRSLQEAAASPPRRPLRPEPSGVRAVDPRPSSVDTSSEIVELDVDPDPSLPPPTAAGEEIFESKSRLVSAPPAPLDDGPPAMPSDPVLEVSRIEYASSEDAVADHAADDDVASAFEELREERAPSSSRRPISIEEKMNEVDDAPPIHTPPPESGRLPAAVAMEMDFGAATTGVRKLDAMLEEERAAAIVTRAEAGAGDAAIFVGEAPRARAPTFGELLDEALRL